MCFVCGRACVRVCGCVPFEGVWRESNREEPSARDFLFVPRLLPV